MATRTVVNVATGQATQVELTPEEIAAIPVEPLSVPDLSFPQLLHGLKTEGWITEAEAYLWLDGTLPAPVLAVIAQLPEAARFLATARANKPTSVMRSDALVAALGALQGKTSGELDTFFRTYAVV